MGATNIGHIAYGFNERDVYDTLCRRADEYYGHQDGYSGQINSTYGFTKHNLKGVDSTKLVPLNSNGKIDSNFLKKIYKHEEELLERFNDCTLACINLGIMCYVKVKVSSKQLSKRQFDSYIVKDVRGNHVIGANSLESACKQAEKYINERKVPVKIVGYLKNKTEVILKEYSVTLKETRRKPTDMIGCYPKYAYWFIGFAKC